jgi:CheY-like chemotaxis protein
MGCPVKRPAIGPTDARGRADRPAFPAFPLSDAREPNVTSATTRVLIIDDDPLIRTLLVTALRKDCLVGVAADGAEGFDKALALRPDVAVIDVNMPGWDGLKTVEEFRASAVLRDVKIIMLTADASKQTVMAAVRAGANDYLIKTAFSKADFYQKLNKLLPGTIRHAALVDEPREVDAAFARAEPPHARDRAISDASSAELFGTRPHPAEPLTPGAALSDNSEAHSDVDPRLQVMIDGWE